MRLDELTREQKVELKQNLLTERLGDPSYGELADADELVSDDELKEKFGGTVFTPDDFMSSNGEDDTAKGSFFAVSVVGVCTDTVVSLHSTRDKAVNRVDELKIDYGMTDVTEMCRDCWSGYDRNGNKIEIEIHTNLAVD